MRWSLDWIIDGLSTAFHYFSEYACPYKRTFWIDGPLATAWLALYGAKLNIPLVAPLLEIMGLSEIDQLVRIVSGVVLLALGLLRVRNEWRRGKQIDKEDG